jgi:cell fate (sporulation/competence/biofilm development) regulator YlbF (YheA/YmcA/DUF963 family)
MTNSENENRTAEQAEEIKNLGNILDQSPELIELELARARTNASAQQLINKWGQLRDRLADKINGIR